MNSAARWLTLTGALIGLALACRIDRAPQGPAALIFAATALAGTALYREATGGCWAACNTGWVCNPTTGRCEPHAHDPPQRLQRPPNSSSPAEPPNAPAPDAGPDAEPP